MNYMSEVAKMLGVELCEEFEIIFPNLNCHATAILNNERLYIKDHNLANQDMWQTSALTNILNGTYTIKRKPWKPNDDEEFYVVQIDGSISRKFWDDCTTHYSYYKLGNCYRTVKDAKVDKEKWVAFYKSDKVLEVQQYEM